MSIIIREKSRIKRFDSFEEYVVFRTEDVVFDHIDDHHVRLQKQFPICQEVIEPSLDSYKRFHLRFYLPLDVFQDKHKRIKKCFILFNGLDEIDHFTLYDQIGKGLCKNGYGAILLPLPDHLNRNMEYRFNDPAKRKRPSESFINEPNIIYSAYLQSIQEVKTLLDHLLGQCNHNGNDECCEFYRRFFDVSLTISLLGYSIGGLAALSNFLIQNYEINSCIMLNSGAKLSDIDVSEFQSAKKWQSTVKKLSSDHYHDGDKNSSHELFNMAFLGNNIDALKDRLQEKNRKLLFIIGGADSVTKFKSIRQIEPDSHGLTILKLPGIHHFLSIDTHWDQWFPVVNDMIRSFDQSASNQSLLPNDILGSLTYFQNKYRISDRLEHFDQSRIADSFERDSFSRTLFAAKGTYGSVQKTFIEMYMLLERAKKRPHLYPDYTSEQYEGLFGAIASRLYNIKQEDITHALREQANRADCGDQIPYFGEILKSKQLLNESQIQTILEKQSEFLATS